MYIPPNYPPYFHTYGNFCPCCGKPLGYNTWNPNTPYGPIYEYSANTNSLNMEFPHTTDKKEDK